MGYKSSTYRLTCTNEKGQHARTAAQKADDMERHANSLRKIALEENRMGIAGEVGLHDLKTKWLYRIRHRAKKLQVPCDLTIDDLELPEKCPILGIPMQFNTVSPDENSYSLDRIDNTKGYTKSNVQIISHLANMLKSKATLEQLEKLGEWATKQRT